MKRWVLAMTLLCATIGCAERAFDASSPEVFAGEWRSVTPSLEFIRLSVTPKSSEMGVMWARLTLSGLLWEGDARMTGDSLVAVVTIPGAVPTERGEIRARARDAHTLLVRFHPGAGATDDLTFVRER